MNTVVQQIAIGLFFDALEKFYFESVNVFTNQAGERKIHFNR